jgi:hypothetical protein
MDGLLRLEKTINLVDLTAQLTQIRNGKLSFAPRTGVDQGAMKKIHGWPAFWGQGPCGRQFS